MRLPPLQVQHEMQRRLSLPEYYHCAIGTHPRSLLPAREIVFVLEGEGRLDVAALQRAVTVVAAQHPACRLRLVGHGLWARWRSDGETPVVIDAGLSLWDGRQAAGAPDFSVRPLDLRRGVAAELVVHRLGMGGSRLTLRILHAASDGRGCLHWLADVFRVLRGEAALGVNAVFADTELMRHRAGQAAPRPTSAPSPLVPRRPGGQADWCRLSLSGARTALLPKVAAAIAAFSARHGQAQIRLALPVDLRRHHPDLLASHHLSSMLHLAVHASDTPAQIRARLAATLADAPETAWQPWLGVCKALPLRSIDGLFSARSDRRQPPPLLETAVISNLGRQHAATFSGQGFQARQLYGIPIAGNAFVFLFGLDDGVELIAGLPADMAWAMPAWMEHLRGALAQD